jgi:cadmium resistance protein CadD (predicted permease)
MTDFVSLLATGVTAFVASNIDDTFVLILLFSTPGLLVRNIILGQFLGIGVLVLISSFAAFLALAVPLFVIGLMGFIPIILGIKRLLELQEAPIKKKEILKTDHLSILFVSAVTISNGGDDIGVFTPLFAKYNTPAEVTILVILLMVVTGLWCVSTFYFIKHPFVVSRVKYFTRIITPFALIGIGVYIILDSFVL